MLLIEQKCPVLANKRRSIRRVIDVSNASCKNTDWDVIALVKFHNSQKLAVVVPTG